MMERRTAEILRRCLPDRTFAELPRFSAIGIGFAKAFVMPKVLLLDDDRIHARLLDSWLCAAGYEVGVTHTADDAVARLSEGWDALVTDFHLQDGDSMHVLREARERFPRIATVVVTAAPTLESVTSAMRSHADALLDKLAPLRPNVLCNELKDAIAAHQAAPAPTPVTSRQVVLAIGALATDIEFGCGGTLANHRAQGHDVVTLGVMEAAAEQSTRQRGMLTSIGAGLALNDIANPMVVSTVIERALSIFSPTIIYCPSAHDHRAEQRAINVSMVSAATSAAAAVATAILCYQSPTSTPDFRPSQYVEISTHLDGKLDRCHNADLRAHAATNARYWSRYTSSKAVEPFEVYRARGALG